MTKNPQRTPSAGLWNASQPGPELTLDRKNSRKEPHRPQPGPSARCAVNTTTHTGGVCNSDTHAVQCASRAVGPTSTCVPAVLRSCGKRSSLPGRVARQRDRFLATAIELRLPPARALFSASGRRGFASPFIRLRLACIEWHPITTAVQPDRYCHQPLYRCSSRP